MNMNEAIKIYNRAGGHFFDVGTMKFWESRIESELMNDKYFVTSEPDYNRQNRRYTVRRFRGGGFTDVETVGEFRQYGSCGAAMSAIRELIIRGE